MTLVESYFDAWARHDCSAIEKIFHQDAKYLISGKDPITGSEGITRYWQINSKRQKQLTVYPIIINNIKSSLSTYFTGESTVDIAFCAKFFDSEEKENQTVYGSIQFTLDNEKIVAVYEKYHVHRTPGIRAYLSYKFTTLSSFLCERLGIFFSKIKIFIIRFMADAQLVLMSKGTVIVSYLMAVSLGFSATKVGNFPDWMLCWLSFDNSCSITDDTIREKLVEMTGRRLSSLTAALIFAVPIMYHIKSKLTKQIKTETLIIEGQDLEIMKEQFRNARKVSIFSGDFDFIKNDPKMLAILEKLDEGNGLELVSSKSESEVRRGFGERDGSARLFNALLSKGKIKFDGEVPLKCSIVHSWNYTRVLYRFEHGGTDEDSHRLRLCILEGRGEASPLVDLIERLCKKNIRSAI
jgi:hypothetical protein